MNQDRALRDHVLYLLSGGGAHAGIERTFADVRLEFVGKTVAGFPHSIWQLLEHMRICQWDILRFSVDPEHVSPAFPDGLWPDKPEPPSTQAWHTSLAQLNRELEEMKLLVADANNDLLRPFAHGTGQTLLREALLVADHHAYHLGQVVMLRRQLGDWHEDDQQP